MFVWQRHFKLNPQLEILKKLPWNLSSNVNLVCYAGLSRSVVSDTLWPHGLWPASLLCPWGFSCKCEWILVVITSSQGLGRFKFCCVCIHSCSVMCNFLQTFWTVACQASLSMGIFRQKYWSELPFSSSRGSSWPRDWTCVSCISCIADGFFTRRAEPSGKSSPHNESLRQENFFISSLKVGVSLFLIYSYPEDITLWDLNFMERIAH